MEATETITRPDPADPHAIPSSVVVHYGREIVGEGMWQAQRDRLTFAGAILETGTSSYRLAHARSATAH